MLAPAVVPCIFPRCESEASVSRTMRSGRALVRLVLVLPSLEFLVSTEEVFQGSGNHVRRSRANEFCITVQLSLDGFFNARLDRDRLWLFRWCFNDSIVLPQSLLRSCLTARLTKRWNLLDSPRPKHELRSLAARGGSDPRSPKGSGRDCAARWGRSRLWSCFGRVPFPCLVSRIFFFFLRVRFSPH